MLAKWKLTQGSCAGGGARTGGRGEVAMKLSKGLLSHMFFLFLFTLREADGTSVDYYGEYKGFSKFSYFLRRLLTVLMKVSRISRSSSSI